MPDGQQATIISPMATGSEKRKNFTIPKANAGIIRYCDRKPTIAGLGWRIASLKSRMERVQPRPNIMTKVISMSRFVSVGVSIG